MLQGVPQVDVETVSLSFHHASSPSVGPALLVSCSSCEQIARSHILPLEHRVAFAGTEDQGEQQMKTGRGRLQLLTSAQRASRSAAALSALKLVEASSGVPSTLAHTPLRLSAGRLLHLVRDVWRLIVSMADALYCHPVLAVLCMHLRGGCVVHVLIHVLSTCHSQSRCIVEKSDSLPPLLLGLKRVVAVKLTGDAKTCPKQTHLA